jgi:hypothetical protein
MVAAPNKTTEAKIRRQGEVERPVFEPYRKGAHVETVDWIARHGIFAESGMGRHRRYEDSVISLPGANRL